MKNVEVINRDGRWFVKADERERQFPGRHAAVEAAQKLTDEDVPVIHERSAHVTAKISFK